MTDTVNYLTIPEPDVDDTLGLVTLAMIEADMPGHATLRTMQEIVGGYVECIDVRHPVTGTVASIWFNDSGKIDGLPENPLATAIAGIGGWAGVEYGDTLRGNAVITGIDHTEGETVSIPEDWKILASMVATMLPDHMYVIGGGE